MTDSHTQRLSFWMAAGLAVGAGSGVLFAGADLLGKGIDLAAREASQIALFFALIGALGTCPAFTLVGLALRGRVNPTSAAVTIGAMAGIAAQVALLLCLSPRGLILAVPFPWLIAWVFFHQAREHGAIAFAMGGLSVVLGAALFVPAIMSTGGPRGTMSVLATAGAALASALLLQRFAARRAWIPAVLALALGLMQVFGGRSPRSVMKHVTVDATEIAAVAPATPAARTATLPNIVLVVLDTTRRDHLGCYGNREGLTPVLDALAAEGTVYEDMIAQASWTVPSHASLFTGLYPKTHGCDYGEHRWLDDGFVTLAEMLGVLGYQTVSLSANHYLAQSNLLQGFEYRLEPWSELREADLYYWTSRAGLPTPWADHGAQNVTRLTREWFQTRYAPGRPVLLFVNLMESHWPLYPPAAWRARHLPAGVGFLEATRTSSRFYGPKWHAGQRHTDQAAETIRHLYKGSVAYQDFALGRLMDLLRERMDWDNTLVIVTADHGENLGEGQRWDHVFALNDALIHVPFVVRYPPKFPAGRRIAGQCELVDVVPTVFDMLGAPCPVGELPGASALPERFQAKPYALAQVSPYYGHLERLAEVTGFQRDTTEFLAELRTVRNGRYKYVWSSRGDHRLYDLQSDPWEERNVAASLESVASGLADVLESRFRELPQYVPRPISSSAGLDEEALKRLRSLGYIGNQ